MTKLSSPIVIVQKSIKIFFEKKNLKTFLTIYSVTVPFSILTALQDGYLKSHSKDVSLGGSPFVLSFALVKLGLAIISFWVGVAAILAIRDILAGKNVIVAEVFRVAWKKLLMASILAIVIGLITGIGFLLLIIPGIVFLVWFSFANFELVTKGTGIRESLVRSKKLVEGRFWAVLGRMFVFGIFIILTQIIFGIFPYIGGIITALLGGLYVLPYYLLYQEVSEV